jgi:hypothetical protein
MCTGPCAAGQLDGPPMHWYHGAGSVRVFPLHACVPLLCEVHHQLPASDLQQPRLSLLTCLHVVASERPFNVITWQTVAQLLQWGLWVKESLLH